MPARKPQVESRRPGLAPGHADGASALLGGVLHRMEEVLGPGAIYSLVHYVAVEEGRQLVDGGAPGAVDAVAQRVAGLLGLKVRLDVDKGKGLVRARVNPAPHFRLDNRAGSALVVGLLEGALTTAYRRKMQVNGTPGAQGDGSLDLEFGG